MIDGHTAFIDPSSVIGVVPAHQQSNIAPGSTVVAGSFLLIAGGAQIPVKGNPETVVNLLAQMVAH